MRRLDNQQERPKNLLDPWYITGFVEGEGTFHVAIYKDPRMRSRIKIVPEFHVNQHHLRIETLRWIKEYFKCGYIKENHRNSKRDKTLVYVVRDREDLKKRIIPFFERYPLLSKKRESFELFKKIVLSLDRKVHSTRAGAKKLLNLAYQMNEKGKYRKVNKKTLIDFLESSETVR